MRLTRRVVLVVAAALLLATGWTAFEALTAQEALHAARAGLVDARRAASAGELDVAARHSARASAAADRARRRTDGPLWALAQHLPVAGPPARTVVAVAQVADATTDVVSEAIRHSGELLGGGGALPLRGDEGGIDLAPLERAADTVAAMPVEELAAAHAQLTRAPAEHVPRVVRDARRDALEAAAEVLTLVERVQLTVDVMPRLLGAERPRHFLLTVQNPAELRGTGGIIGFLAVLETDRGSITLSAAEGVDPAGLAGDTDIVVRSRFTDEALAAEPVTMPDAFAARYGELWSGWNLVNTNLDPDLPTVAPVELAIYERVTGRALEGVVALDPVGLQRLYRAVGPLDVPDDVAALTPELPDPIPAERIAEVLLVDVYDALGGPTTERRRYQAAVAEAALTDFLSRRWDAVDVARAISDMLAGRHLQVVSTDPAEQAALERLGVAGELRPAQPHDDLLAVTANNVSGNKADVHVAHRISHDIELLAPRALAGESVVDRRLSTTVTIDNGLGDGQHDPYITNPLPWRGQVRAELPSGLIRTWITHWLPPDSDIESVHDADGEVAGWSDEIHGRVTADHFLVTEAQTSAAATVVSRATLPLDWDGQRATYSVTFWRQAKAIADQLDATIAAPDGWHIVAVKSVGGGAPRGLGPADDGERVVVTHDDRTVRISGAVTTDLRVEVVLQPQT